MKMILNLISSQFSELQIMKFILQSEARCQKVLSLIDAVKHLKQCRTIKHDHHFKFSEFDFQFAWIGSWLDWKRTSKAHRNTVIFFGKTCEDSEQVFYQINVKLHSGLYSIYNLPKNKATLNRKIGKNK